MPLTRGNREVPNDDQGETMSTTTELTDQQMRDLQGTEHTITVTITNFTDRGRLARVRVPGGEYVMVPVAELGKES